VAVKDAMRLAELLAAKGWREGEDFIFRRIQGGAHNEAAWAARVPPMLEYLFPDHCASAL
jgi:hypothetical protein